MNWGTKIAIFYTIFAVSMLSAVIFASMQTFHLVSPNYYEEELAFETRIQEIRQAKALAIKWEIKQIKRRELELHFPKNLYIKEGIIRFYRPSDAALDQSIPLETTQAIQIVKLEKWHAGNWKLQFSWTDGTLRYFSEQNLHITL